MAYHEGKTKSNPGLSAKTAWLPPTSGLRDWRSEMEERDLAVFETIAGDMLTELGYERADDSFSPEVAAVALRCKNWWEAKMADRLQKAAASSKAAA